MNKIFYIFVLVLCVAFKPEESLTDNKLEKTANQIFKKIKCLTCEGESISDSSTQFAKDSRAVVREKLKRGYSKQKIISFFQNSYGEEILIDSYKVNFFSKIILYLLPIVFLAFFSLRSLKYVKK